MILKDQEENPARQLRRLREGQPLGHTSAGYRYLRADRFIE